MAKVGSDKRNGRKIKMESSTNYATSEKLILFDFDEDPLSLIPDGWIILERTEPSIYKGFKNLGSITCCPPKTS